MSISSIDRHWFLMNTVFLNIEEYQLCHKPQWTCTRYAKSDQVKYCAWQKCTNKHSSMSRLKMNLILAFTNVQQARSPETVKIWLCRTKTAQKLSRSLECQHPFHSQIPHRKLHVTLTFTIGLCWSSRCECALPFERRDVFCSERDCSWFADPLQNNQVNKISWDLKATRLTCDHDIHFA